MLITFNLKGFKILKNALIFSVLGIKRNLMALLGIILLLLIHFISVIFLLPLGLTVTIVIPFVYIFATIAFIVTYAAYPVIDKYMIAPYKAEITDEE